MGLADGAGAHRPADRARADPAEPADRRPRRSTRRAEGVARGGYILAEASDGAAAGDPHRHRLRGAALPDRAGAAGGRGHRRPGSCRCRARSGSASRTRPTGSRCCRRGVKARVSVEAGIAMSWRDLVGDAGECVSIEHYGASAPYQVLFEQFGFTPDQRGRRGARVAVAGSARSRAPPPATERRTSSQGACAMTDRLAELSAAGVAIWLDDLSRERLSTGGLDQLRREKHVVGVTTNPTIFAKALRRRRRRTTEQLKDLAAARRRRSTRRRGMLTTYDVRWACDVMRPGVRRVARASTAGSPSRSTRGWPTRPTRPSPRPRRCGGWSTGRTCSSRSRRPRPACRRSPRRSPRASAST